MSSATFYKWRAKYGVNDVSMMTRVKALEQENRRLKKRSVEKGINYEIVEEVL